MDHNVAMDTLKHFAWYLCWHSDFVKQKQTSELVEKWGRFQILCGERVTMKKWGWFPLDVGELEGLS